MPSTLPPFQTCDLCDAHQDDPGAAVRVLSTAYRDFGGVRRFGGPVATVRCFEDNTLVRAAVESPGQGRVLVVDGGGSLQRALPGANLGALAVRNGWAGVLVHGCVRDTAELAVLPVGVRALAAVPMPPHKHEPGQGAYGEVLGFAGFTVQPGDWLFADEDGVVISALDLLAVRPHTGT